MKTKWIVSWVGVVVAAIFLSAACKTYEPPAATIFVTVMPIFSDAYVFDTNYPSTVPDTVSGKIVLDTDKNLLNGYEKSADFTLNTSDLTTTNGLTCEFEDVVAGSYYVYAVVDTDGNGALSISPDDRDAFSFYGNITTTEYNVASKARLVTVIDGDSFDCDFWMGTPYNHG